LEIAAEIDVWFGRVALAIATAGVALSSEYVYAVRPGVPIPDDRFFAVLWVDRSAAEAAFDMKGAFNDLVVSLAPGADAKPVIACPL
jgi:putative ABC transport system permease protein